MSMTPSRPYLVRAMYEWLLDNNATPHLVVDVEKPGVSVPEEYVQDGHITLDLTPTAVGNLLMKNDFIEFQAGFGGVLRDIYVPMNAVRGIYAQENAQGMFFDDGEYAALETEEPTSKLSSVTGADAPEKASLKPVEQEPSQDKTASPAPEKKRPTLTIVK